MRSSFTENQESHRSPQARLNGGPDDSLVRLRRTRSAIRLLLGRKKTARLEGPSIIYHQSKFSEQSTDDEEQIKQMDESKARIGMETILEHASCQLCHLQIRLTEHLGTNKNPLTSNSAPEKHSDARSEERRVGKE